MANFNIEFVDDSTLRRMEFRSAGTHVLIDSSAKFIGTENISIGSHVRIDANTIIIASGPVHIGSWVHISANCYLEGRAGITLGDFCNLSNCVSLHSVSDDFSGRSLTNPMTPENLKTLEMGKIILGRHAAVGAKATILPGVHVGEGGVVGAHSLVRENIPAWAIHAGTPARRIGNRLKDLLELEKKMPVKDSALPE